MLRCIMSFDARWRQSLLLIYDARAGIQAISQFCPRNQVGFLSNASAQSS
jgi:hypothetical protein